VLLNGIWLPQGIVNTLTDSPMLLLYQLQAGLMGLFPQEPLPQLSLNLPETRIFK